MSETPNTGPSRDTLRALKAFLPSLKKGIKDGSLTGKGKVSKPRKMCKVCGKLWDFMRVPTGSNTLVAGDFCAKCDSMLKEGLLALVYADKFAFIVPPPELEDLRGTIVHVSLEVFRDIERKFKAQEQKNGINQHGVN